MKIPVLIFFGATASGKTDIASRIFSNNAEVISADSIQVYNELKIGSARPSENILNLLPHHLVDILSPDLEFSVSDFVEMSDKLCLDIFRRNKLPVLLGGTAFFLKNFMYGLPITPKSDPEIRLFFQERAKKEGTEILLKELHKIDPETAKRLHKNDEYRIIRAHEIFASTGKPLSSYKLSEKYRENYDFFVVGINRPREILYSRIEKRVDLMIEAGLYEEVRALIKKGYKSTAPALKAIGYREFFLPKGELKTKEELENIIQLIKKNTKRYAKRQETFFKTIPNTNYYNVENGAEILKLQSDINSFLNKYFD